MSGRSSSTPPRSTLHHAGVQDHGLTLDETRGFPFQVVAESKYGYKWVKWLTGLELTDQDYLGYWERRGYDNSADLEE